MPTLLPAKTTIGSKEQHVVFIHSANRSSLLPKRPIRRTQVADAQQRATRLKLIPAAPKPIA